MPVCWMKRAIEINFLKQINGREKGGKFNVILRNTIYNVIIPMFRDFIYKCEGRGFESLWAHQKRQSPCGGCLFFAQREHMRKSLWAHQILCKSSVFISVLEYREINDRNFTFAIAFVKSLC